MVGIAEEYDAQIDLVIQEYLELQKRSPGHELLSLVSLHQDKMGFDLAPDFKNRCLPANFTAEHSHLHAIGNYYAAMRNAVKGLPYELPPKPEPKKPTEESFFYESLDDLFH